MSKHPSSTLFGAFIALSLGFCQSAQADTDCCGVPDGDNTTCGGSGDANGDWVVNIFDILLVCQDLFSVTGVLDECALNEVDINSSGYTNVLDIVVMIDIVVSSHPCPNGTVHACSGAEFCYDTTMIGDDWCDADLSCYSNDDGDCDTLHDDVVCGDGVLDVSDPSVDTVETCDDGNVIDGDGCGSSCQIEPQCTQGCVSTDGCDVNETCVGQPSWVSGATGQCEDTTESSSGSMDGCDSTDECQEGLVCLGEFQWGSGWCVQDWFAKDFFSYDNQPIGEGDLNEGLSSSLIVCGLATVPVDIVVTLELDHPRFEDLVITLEDPNGQTGTVLDHQSWDGQPIVTTVGSGDDTVNGEWTLHVLDTLTGETGRLLGWSLYLTSNWD